MKHRPQHPQLHTLRFNLEHFHHSPDFGDGADVEAIKQFLALRIREAEHAQRHNERIQIEAA
jgi:hypothetical protein